MTDINFKRLHQPFLDTDLEWRIQSSGSTKNGGVWVRAVAYVTSRAVQNRLDNVVGAGNWRNELQPIEGGFLCGLSIRVDGEWVTKWDGAPTTQIESIKGGISDALKRAAVQWGIGRYLYSLDADFIPRDCISTERKNGAEWNWSKASNKTPEFWWKAPPLPLWAQAGKEAPPKASSKASSNPPAEKPSEQSKAAGKAPNSAKASHDASRQSPASERPGNGLGPWAEKLRGLIRRVGQDGDKPVDTSRANELVRIWSHGLFHTFAQISVDESACESIYEEKVVAQGEMWESSPESRSYPD